LPLSLMQYFGITEARVWSFKSLLATRVTDVDYRDRLSWGPWLLSFLHFLSLCFLIWNLY
jgi:hypothetical protein